MKKIVKISVVLAIAMLISVMAVATVSATTDIKNEKKNTGITSEYKEKKITSYKVTWNANGGKIGSKKTKVTNIKKGSKIKKLAPTPKRNHYSFKGWFNKKSGGKKITKNTKITKKATFYAQWTKKSSSSTTNDKSKLIGMWSRYDNWPRITASGSISYSYLQTSYTFNADGTFSYGRTFTIIGNYKISNDKITFTKISSKDIKVSRDTAVIEYKIKKVNGKEQMELPMLCTEKNIGQFTKH